MAPRTALKRKAAGPPAVAPPPPAKKAKGLAHGPSINDVPSERKNVFVFGEGSAGELGLGNSKKPPTIDVKRPRLNPFLDSTKVGAVDVAAGGMHTVVITHDNKVLTWGVNDIGALGRDTTWAGKTKPMDAASTSSDDEDDDPTNDLNPKESTPGEVDWSGVEIAPGTKFTQAAAGDSCSFVLTDDGKVYGWGTFRGNDGIIGFTPDVRIATRPLLLKDLKDITSIKAGTNHCFALDSKGKTYSWGAGQQDQLGRRVIERTAAIEGLRPRQFGLPHGRKNHVIAIESGNYHGFALTSNGDVYSWGLNSQSQTGIPSLKGDDGTTIRPPQIVTALQDKDIVAIAAGHNHSVAATKSGECYAWGRADGSQLGIEQEVLAKLPLNKAMLLDGRGKPRVVVVPQKVTAIKGAVTKLACGPDHTIAITKDGKAWSWGFSANYQTGQGTDDDIVVATMMDNTAIRDKIINGAGAGGQYSLLTAATDVEMTNGI